MSLQEDFEKNFKNFYGEKNHNYFDYYYHFTKKKEKDVDVDVDDDDDVDVDVDDDVDFVDDDLFKIQMKIEERFYDLGKLFGYEKSFLLMNIKQVALSEKYQKQGYFRLVMKFIEKYCKSKGIHLLVSQILNPKLVMTLKKNNFIIVIDNEIKDEIKEEDMMNMTNVNAVKIFERPVDDSKMVKDGKKKISKKKKSRKKKSKKKSRKSKKKSRKLSI